MPKNTVTDPITDQEMAFAHLVLSGTMNDRQAAETAGLNPDSAAYIKSKPRVRDYMLEHRAAVSQKLVEQEAEGLRKLNIGRDQILARLWELANLSPEATRGSITGQVKAMSMILAVEGLIPDRRASSSETKPAAPPVKPQIYQAEWLRKQHQQAASTDPANPAPATEPESPAPQIPEPELSPKPVSKPSNDPNHPNPIDPFITPKGTSWVPATSGAFDDLLHATNALRLPFSLPKNPFGSRR
jgi:hypothetical protein